MAENSETDWILINLKFKGKCVECGKIITSGRGLWSRSAKSIKHQKIGEIEGMCGLSI